MSNASAHSTAYNAGIRIDMDCHWECPSCGRQHVTKANGNVETPMHSCTEFHGAWMPFVPAGTKAAYRLNDREDYIGSDIPFTDAEGRVIMSVTVQREDGEDCFIMAPAATSGGSASSPHDS